MRRRRIRQVELSRELLRERYFSKLKATDELFVGIELEFPIVNLSAKAVVFSVVFELFSHIVDQLPFSIEKTDTFERPIQLVSDENEDRILFEVGYNTLEFAFDKAKTIQEVDDKFKQYLSVIQPFLKNHNHLLTGFGVNPFWHKNDNRPVASQRYEMLMAYLKLGRDTGVIQEERYQFGAFIQGSQVQLDVTPDTLMPTLNDFNAIEPAKAWLFANSYLWHTHLETLISRDIFWEESMHGVFDENVGVFTEYFEDQEQFLDYLEKTALFSSTSDDDIHYFNPIQADDYFNHDEISGFNLSGESNILTPSPYDFNEHRSYQYQSLTTRGTVEFRSSCAQPIADTFTVAAFHLGLMVELPAFTELVKSHPFYEDYGRDYKQLRRRFAAQHLSDDEVNDVAMFAKDLLDLATSGLKKRGFGEAVYLSALYQRIALKQNPALVGLKLFESGKTLSEISEIFANEKDF